MRARREPGSSHPGELFPTFLRDLTSPRAPHVSGPSCHADLTRASWMPRWPLAHLPLAGVRSSRGQIQICADLSQKSPWQHSFFTRRPLNSLFLHRSTPTFCFPHKHAPAFCKYTPKIQMPITFKPHIQLMQIKYVFHVKLNALPKYKLCFLFCTIKIGATFNSSFNSFNIAKLIPCPFKFQIGKITYVCISEKCH